MAVGNFCRSGIFGGFFVARKFLGIFGVFGGWGFLGFLSKVVKKVKNGQSWNIDGVTLKNLM